MYMTMASGVWQEYSKLFPKAFPIFFRFVAWKERLLVVGTAEDNQLSGCPAF
jgi:hypothetical protein